ncbi:tannase and feruloyl esterase-domain-containing protein [Aspergillus stella-maris]|uniref:tannase and feruloyl esterase-domain-containing protein n=1 Tax=Aspergillus stella-maris TaxID=1810926 RepID=UPI003CCC9CEA
MSLSNVSVANSPFVSACNSLLPPTIPNTTILWQTSNAVQNFTYPSIPDITGEIPPTIRDNRTPLTFCNVTIALTHTDADRNAKDTSFITIWLPPQATWNGRYAATGGGGLAAGVEYNMLSPLASGFATSSTDGGLTLNHTIQPNSGLWVLKPDGSFDETLLTNLGWRSINDMALASKDLISQFYGRKEEYSYFIGCSQGGRQGYAAASKYPDLFNGILASSPALGMEYIGPAAFWPFVVMGNEGEFVPNCVLERYQGALLESCDDKDGLKDGMVADYTLLTSCAGTFNTASLVGTHVTCPQGKSNANVTITDIHARILRKILDGPIHPSTGKKYFFGATPGANLSGVAGTAFNTATQSWTPRPFPPAAGWLQNAVSRNGSRDLYGETLSLDKLSYEEYFTLFDKSISLGGPYLGDSYLDLTPFHEKGGKLLSWIGLADPLIPPQYILNFYDATSAKLSDPKGANLKVNDFYRLFTAPGVGHCYGGVGPQPIHVLERLMGWVENGTPPETLEGGKRELCLYPRRSVFREGSWGCEMPGEDEDEVCDSDDENVDEDGGEGDDDESGGMSAFGVPRGTHLIFALWTAAFAIISI